MRRILLATANPGKIRDFAGAAVSHNIEVAAIPHFGSLPTVVEDGLTFEENARKKAEQYSLAVPGELVLADDSGLEVDALAGGPGVRTRRYAGEDATDEANNTKLLVALRDLPPERRGARYVCVLALALPDAAGPRGGVRVVTARGTCRGRIATEPRGGGGFGYDPIFEPAEEPPGGRTLGLWTPAEKHAVSHRARAARRMAPRLAALGL